MTRNKDHEESMRKFGRIQGRQLLAVTASLCAIVILAVLSKRSDLFGQFSNNTVSAVQIIIIVAFLNFSAWNWRCPSCKKYLGHDITKKICKKCGTRLR